MQELQDDPYIQLPVDQSLLFDYNDVVFNNLDDYMNRKERFLKSPDKLPLQLLLQFNYEIINKENFRIMSEIIEFLSLHYKTSEPPNPSYFLLITTVIQEILLTYIEELGQSNSNPSNTLRLDLVQ
jgi:hypothetical protein